MSKTIGTAYKKAQIDAKEDANGTVIEITELWHVRLAFASDVNNALAATGLPASNSQHGTYTDLRVSSREPEMQDNGIIWNIVITYSLVNEVDAVNEQRLINIDFDTYEAQVEVVQNLGTGKAIVDGAGKPPVRALTAPREFPWIKINKKLKTFTRSTVLSHSGTINDDAVTVAGVVIPKWAGKIRIRATETIGDEYPWDVSFEVKVRYKSIANYIDFAGAKQAASAEVGWMEDIVNEGFFIQPTGSDLTRAIELVEYSDGSTEERPSAAPVLLDESGDPLAEGSTPITILVQTIPDADWSGLGLNNL